jgi:hypothetical protein
MRKRAVFTGTVGARMALTHMPCACKSAEDFKAAKLLPTTTG